MGFKCGIVGLPNVGKSTLFNALTASKNAEAANFPFCTIDPNIGIVDVADERLDNLSKLSNSKKKIYTNITFVDIAGLVKGASKGEGLGNKFLSHIREVDAIIHLVRCFDSDKITHVNTEINPLSDLETIKTEILLSDIDLIEKKLEKSKKKLLQEKEILILEEKLKELNEGNDISIKNEAESKFLLSMGLLSIKPKIIFIEPTWTHEILICKFAKKYKVSIVAPVKDKLLPDRFLAFKDENHLKFYKNPNSQSGAHLSKEAFNAVADDKPVQYFAKFNNRNKLDFKKIPKLYRLLKI